MRPRTIPCVLLLFLALPPLCGQQAAEGSLDWYSAQARKAIDQSNYETAVKLLTEAKEKYPNAPKVNMELADLYYGKELFTLALEEYRQAEGKGSEDFRTLDQIARCYGKLNQEKNSISYLTRILTLYPDSRETIDDLGWMYFKTFQLEKGEKILLDAIKRFGFERNISMTLGTIYSGMNQYTPAKDFYLKAIDDALKAGDAYFASIAYYNLSLLEHDFYYYNSALAYTDDSISMQDRASGHLARGELLQSRMDYRGALEEYEKAFSEDKTPLAKVNLAILSQRFGHLELARRYAEEVLSSKDLTWMLYYGTDVTRHFQDLTRILADIYAGLSRIEDTRPTAGILDWTRAKFDSIRLRLMGWYYLQRFRLYSLSIGKRYMSEGRAEEAYFQFYWASEGYPDVALSYLNRARAIEAARTPHSGYFYDQEEGRLAGSLTLLEKSLSGFDPFWERDAVADSLIAEIPLLIGKKNAAARRAALNRLFEIDPGAFRQNAIGLPLSIQFPQNSWGGAGKARIVRYLKRAGSELVEMPPGAKPALSNGFRYVLSIGLTPGGNAAYRIADGQTGRILTENSGTFEGGAAARSSALTQSILDDLYGVE
jgi:tetratricopeptide (TPR) repeat protein